MHYRLPAGDRRACFRRSVRYRRLGSPDGAPQPSRRERAERLEALFQGSADGILLLDEGFRIIDMNPAAERLTGWAREEAAGRLRCHDVTACADEHGKPLCEGDCWGKQSRRTGEALPYVETQIRRRDGTLVPTIGSYSPLGGRRGERRFAMILRDATAKKRTDRERQQLLEESQRRREEAQLLYRVGLELAALSDVDRHLQGMLRILLTPFGARWAALALLPRADRPRVRWFVHVGDGEESARTSPLPASGEQAAVAEPHGRSQGERLLDHLARQPAAHSYWLSAERLAEFEEPALPPAWRSIGGLLVAPLARHGELLGYLFLGLRGGLPEPEKGGLLLGIARQLAIAIENVRLYRRVQSLSIVEERQRIAREMHDGMAQYLSYLNLQLQSVEAHLKAGTGQVEEELREARKVLREAYAEVRFAIFDLKQLPEEGGSFASQIANYLREYGDMTGLEIECRVPEELTEHLTTDARLQLFRIVQEALTNVRKHAAAKRVSVRMERGHDRIWLRIADDGRGFVVASAGPQGTEHYGLAIMKERAKSLGGFCDLVSTPGQGTEVIVGVPLVEGGEG